MGVDLPTSAGVGVALPTSSFALSAAGVECLNQRERHTQRLVTMLLARWWGCPRLLLRCGGLDAAMAPGATAPRSPTAVRARRTHSLVPTHWLQ